MLAPCVYIFIQHIEASILMFDHLIKENRDRLEDQFNLWEIDISPDSEDMIFIKELIYGGPLPGNEVHKFAIIIIMHTMNIHQQLRGRPLPQHRFLYEVNNLWLVDDMHVVYEYLNRLFLTNKVE